MLVYINPKKAVIKRIQSTCDTPSKDCSYLIHRLKMPASSLRAIFICTKPVIQIIVWIIVVTAVYRSALEVWPIIMKSPMEKFGLLHSHIFSYLALTSAYIFFPIGGFLGDVYLGRYRAVIASLTMIAVTLTTTSVGAVLYYKKFMSLAIIVLVISVVLLVVGLSLFDSNILQFGLDQLMEKPSEYLGVFVHWVAWAYILGATFPHIVFALYYCKQKIVKHFFHYLLYILPVGFLTILVILFLITYCTRRHFSRDRVKYNPYKMIFKVLNFARKNKYPVGPVSAFAHCYDYRPSRLDYAKERYGGPFTTSDVEDVKTFKNVLLVLLALGPIFTLDAAHTFLFEPYTRHTGASVTFGAFKETCENGVEMVFSGAGVVFAVPIYMWLIYSVFRNRRPKILNRLAAAVLTYILATSSMLAIDLTGHIMLYARNQTQATCMFTSEEAKTNTTLKLHWMAIAIPKFSTSIGFHVTMATSFEFIAAQSPHTMKGVLVGIFFAIVGVFRMLGTIFLIPFSLEEIWGDGQLEQYPPVVSCGFGYYLVCITVAMIGFISFIIAVKRYKYRRRDEEPYSQACVEEIFARRIESRGQYFDYEELSGTNEYVNRENYEELSGSNSSSPE